EAVEDALVVVAENGGVQGHHQAVVGCHAGLVGQQVPAQGGGVGRGDRALTGLQVQAAGVLDGQPGGAGIGVGMVGGDRAVVAEVEAPTTHGLRVSVVGAGVLTGSLAQSLGQLAEVGAGRLEVLVRAEGGDDAAGEGRVLRQGRVGGEVVDRVV